MKILYIGDVMGEPGLNVVREVLPALRTENGIDLVIAQAENLSGGKGIELEDYNSLLEAGVDFCSGGNWTMYREEIYPSLNNPDIPIIRPVNYPKGTPGLGYKYITTPAGKVLVVSLLGHIVGKDAAKPVDNPLLVIDKILEKEFQTTRAATIVNFHGDFSSEKRIIGYYLDGRASLVVGDHWHVPTADASILPKGTAHVTDVGMCGSLDSSLGIRFDVVVKRWRDHGKTRNILETEGRMQFNAIMVETNQFGLAVRIKQIQKIW